MKDEEYQAGKWYRHGLTLLYCVRPWIYSNNCPPSWENHVTVRVDPNGAQANEDAEKTILAILEFLNKETT